MEKPLESYDERPEACGFIKKMPSSANSVWTIRLSLLLWALEEKENRQLKHSILGIPC